MIYRLIRQETIWSKEDNLVWNYIGKEGFRQIQIAESPIELKKEDLVIVMTRGIFEELSYAELERAMINPTITIQEKTNRIIRQIERFPKQDKDNGSILVLLTDEAMEIE